MTPSVTTMAQSERTLTKEQVAERLATHAKELRSLGVRSPDIFGSVARGDARPESDVDLLVEFERVPGFIGYVRLRNRLEQILGRHVDLVMASGLHPRLRERVLREARHVALLAPTRRGHSRGRRASHEICRRDGSPDASSAMVTGMRGHHTGSGSLT